MRELAAVFAALPSVSERTICGAAKAAPVASDDLRNWRRDGRMEQLGVNAQMLVVAQIGQDGVRDAADAHLQRGAVRDHLRNVGAYLHVDMAHFAGLVAAGEDGRQLVAGLGRIAEAVAHFKTALALNPGFAEARSNLEKIEGLQE